MLMNMRKKDVLKTTCKRLVKTSIILLFILVLLARATGSGYIFGYRPLIVLSGSMEPALPVSALVLEKKYSGEEIHPGDIVTYTDTVQGKEIRITHRVILACMEEGFVYTKGDANTYMDEPVNLSRIEGILILAYPYTAETITAVAAIFILGFVLKKRYGDD